MSDKIIKNQPDEGVYSLRQRYLFVSTIVVLLIFAFAWLAQSYVSRSSEQHHQNIEIRHQASQYIRQLRNEILHIEKGLEAFMWGPSNEYRKKVHHNIDSALHTFDLLRLHQWIVQGNLESQLGDFALDLKALHITLDRVMDLRLEKRTAIPVLEGDDVNINQAPQHLLNENNSKPQSEIHYLKHTVEPHFEHLWEYISTLDTSIDNFSQSEAIALGNVANIVAKVLWLICFFGLAVITVAYLYFQTTVLKPIAMLAHSLKSDAAGEHLESLPQVHNLETKHLIDAYKDMHSQIQDRQQALEHIALHDSLTSLPNRYHLMGMLQALCESSQQEQASFAVLMLGLDRFKEINDTLGQYTGDTILKKYGQRLQYLLRESDSIARFAGDEFALLLPNASSEEALYVARKIRSEMEHPIDIEGISLSVSCSIGITLYPDNGKEKEELTRRANIAMAIAKQHKTGITLYEERYDTSSVERISMASKLRQAIQSNGLFLCYQPQFSVHNCELSGVEVLCRWDDQERGLISPEEFIPVAEHTGQIHAITEWVVDTALQQAKAWREKGLDCGVLAINISVFNLHAPNFYTMLETQLRKWSFPASKLMLEITETAMMADPEHAIKTLGKLRQLGLKLSIDDYGTGFSSLSYVKQLPVDELKIDKSFVMDMTTNENDAIIVRSTIDLAHNLGLKVVAEGVDSKEKQDLLEILDCDYMQGFHIGKPIRAHQIEYLLPPLREKTNKVSHLRDFR